MNKINKNTLVVILIMFAIYAIGSLQFLIKEVADLMHIGGMSYGLKLDYLDKQYYRNEFYKYYDWLNGLLPNDVPFSMFYNDKTDIGVYQRMDHKLDYYFYPRYILHKGIEKDIARTLSYLPHIKDQIYPEVVYVMDMKAVTFTNAGGLKHLSIKGKKYFLIAAKDNKGLLIERGYLKRSVQDHTAWNNTAKAFRDLYGKDLNKAVF